MSELSGLFYLVLMVAIGYGASATKLLPQKTADTLPQVLFNICYPAMILDTFLTVDTSVVLGTGLPVVIATIAATLVLLALGLVLFRKAPEGMRSLYIFLMGVGNVTYVAIPLFSVFLPAQAVLVAILHSTAQDPLIWGIYLPFLLERGQRKERPIKNALTSPCLIATALGALICFTGISLPDFIADTAARISAATSPLALLLIGMLVRQYGLISWVRDRRALVYSVLKVLVLPFCLCLVFRLFLSGTDAVLLSILFGSPAPLLSIVWAKQNGQDAAFPVHCFLASTLLFLSAASGLLILLTKFGIL
jgi:predicted permease